MIIRCDEDSKIRVYRMWLDRFGWILVEFWGHFWRLWRSSGRPLPRHWQRGNAKIAMLFVTIYKKLRGGVKSGTFAIPALQWWSRRSKIENFKNFCFLVFRFGWAIVLNHHWSRRVRSARVGSPLVFYTFHINAQSRTGFKRISVNGIHIETSSNFMKFHIYHRKQNLGRPCATLIFGRRLDRGALLEVKTILKFWDFFENFALGNAHLWFL